MHKAGSSVSADLKQDLIPSFLLLAHQDALIVPPETVTSIFRSEQRATFRENAAQCKFAPCCFLPRCEVNHEANAVNVEKECVQRDNNRRFSVKY